MATRNLICMELQGKDKYKTIYCHFDGYLDWNGKMLLKHYNTREKVEKLLNLGNISSLHEKLDPNPSKTHGHGLGIRQEDVVVAYGRDMGRIGEEAQIYSLDELKNYKWIEYIYIFGKNDEWQYMDGSFDKMKNLEEAINKIQKGDE